MATQSLTSLEIEEQEVGCVKCRCEEEEKRRRRGGCAGNRERVGREDGSLPGCGLRDTRQEPSGHTESSSRIVSKD